MIQRLVNRPSLLETDFARVPFLAGVDHVRAGVNLAIHVPLSALAFHDATVTAATDS